MVAKTSVETTNDLLDKMRSLLLIAGVPKEQIQIRSGKRHIDTFIRAFDWLYYLEISLEYREMVAVWALLPEATWGHYVLFQIDGLREQELLKIAQRNLLKKWKTKRPAMFNKDRSAPNVRMDR